MFNIGATELILILVIAFVVVGPQDLPKVARALGRFVRGIRQMMDEVKRETGIDDLEKEFKGVKSDLEGTVNSVKKDLKSADIRPDIHNVQKELNTELGSVKKDVDETLSQIKDTEKKS